MEFIHSFTVKTFTFFMACEMFAVKSFYLWNTTAPNVSKLTYGICQLVSQNFKIVSYQLYVG